MLANLPRTRPQRASARRAAARNAGGQGSATGNGNGRAARRTPQTGGAFRRRRGRPAPRQDEETPKTRAGRKRAEARESEAGPQADDVPRQGFESVEERATGPVQPPGGAELVGTAVEVVSELAKAGISGGERVVRDLLGRLGR